MPGIFFTSLYPGFKLKNSKKISLWVEHIINSHDFFLGNISFIFCKDEYLLELNMNYLEHKDYTDVITFNYNSGRIINGDVFISVDRVSENSQKFYQDFFTELNLVMIHGVLHLLGYNDKTPSDIKKMKSMENNSLEQLKFM